MIEVPIIAGLFGAQIPLVTWLSAAAAVVGVSMLESSSGLSSLVSAVHNDRRPIRGLLSGLFTVLSGLITVL